MSRQPEEGSLDKVVTESCQLPYWIYNTSMLEQNDVHCSSHGTDCLGRFGNAESAVCSTVSRISAVAHYGKALVQDSHHTLTAQLRLGGISWEPKPISISD
ncbi:hypothetical protein IAQ61_001003, partial [Plenodomus lingam]|uniref:Predicted protein n=1 Tax=Leptosphaeria maculans (strain JN3 / isolate v23.1.3 / race Av1-4-5-6-7-8) TaxID=985895 RepID=E5A2L2_LEPMJ